MPSSVAVNSWKALPVVAVRADVTAPMPAGVPLTETSRTWIVMPAASTQL